jgi:hypothetical protein
MEYYKVLSQYDNKKRYRWNNHGQGVADGSILVANELYTPCEFAKLANCPAWFEKVNIPKRNIYFFFGARFEK